MKRNFFTRRKTKAFIIISLILMYFLCYKNINNISKNTLNVNHNKRIVYLTFDDGPTKIITPKLLDVLKQHDVKATFFVVGKEIEGTEDILLRMYKEGHGIGLHTYSHNYKKVYSSQDIFIDEMIKTKEKVKAITGYTSNIIRFPGGSAKQLNKGFLEKLHKNNLKVFDWNVNLCDGINANLPVNKLVNNAKRYKNNYSRLIVLMHCNSNNKNTVKALPEIIKYYKNLGYEFKAITNDTKEFYYRFKK